jgi:ribonucleoside-diphosphate reductase alpha chain
MITIGIDHPDVLDFIKAKRDLKAVRYANISVRVTDEFMHAVEADKDFTLRFESEVVGRVERKIRARDLWEELIKTTRDWAEPGLIFWDTIKRYSPSEYNGMEIITTNPCGEEPLQAYGACDLGSINLPAFVLDQFSDRAALDWKTLEKAVRYAVRFLDNVLDYNMDKHALAAQREASRQSRRIGVGVTGLADMFVKLKIKYDSDKALAFADSLFNEIKRIAYDESCEIAVEKGSFPAFDREKHMSMEFVKGLDVETRVKISKCGLRNVTVMTIPPVGSGSVLVGTSSGIEPIFAFSYTRRSESLSQEYFKVYHPLVSEYMKLAGLTEEKDLPEFFVPSHKIMPEFRVKMQGVIQRHVDSAISSTVNLPKDTTVEQVEQIYMQAWKAGCKGITVYREGSREGVLITDEELKAKESLMQDWNRPNVLVGKTIKLKVMQGTLYLTANFDKNALKEVFIELGKAGSEEKSYCEAIGRLISKYLQVGGDVKDVISSIKGIRSNAVMWDHGLRIYSIPDAIAKALEMATGQENLSPHVEATTLTDTDAPKAKAQQEGTRMETCPSCGEPTVANEGGCMTCKSCGYTRCG